MQAVIVCYSLHL